MQQPQKENKMTDKDVFDKYMSDQLDAFHEWIWCFGVDTGMNLREYFNNNELMHIWITRYAKDFHDNYIYKEVDDEKKKS